MKITVQVQLKPSTEQKEMLLETMRTANAACDWLSRKVWESGKFRQYDLHMLAYHACRAAFPMLSAQVVVRAEAKVADAYKLDRERLRKFRPLGAIAYDCRILSWKADSVSIWTVNGRQKIGFVCGERQKALLKYERGEAELAYRNGKFYLLVSVGIPDVEEGKAEGWLGIDLGVNCIAVDSDGVVYDEPKIEKVRQRRAAHRKRLGKAAGAKRRRGKRPRSIRRAIQRHKGKESRFKRDVNHCISKRIVEKAKDTGRGIGLEKLTGIRQRTEELLRRQQRSRHSSWAYAQLQQFVEYKAKLRGVPIVAVDPRNTSRRCSVCGHCEKANRQSQAEFHCRACGHTAHADHNAARNIARSATVNRHKVS